MKQKTKNPKKGYSAMSARYGKQIVASLQAYLDEAEHDKVNKELKRLNIKKMSTLFFHYLNNFHLLEIELQKLKKDTLKQNFKNKKIENALHNMHIPVKSFLSLIETSIKSNDRAN